jgi:hypothetical protein
VVAGDFGHILFGGGARQGAFDLGQDVLKHGNSLGSDC